MPIIPMLVPLLFILACVGVGLLVRRRLARNGFDPRHHERTLRRIWIVLLLAAVALLLVLIVVTVIVGLAGGGISIH